MKRIISVIAAVLIMLALPLYTLAVSTSAKAAILINADTCEVIYEHNADQKLPMASTTKIMTALLLCENGDLEREVTVTAEMLRVEGSSMGLLAGDRVTLHDLLYGMMLASGNDAANVTAYILGGTVSGFVKKMNEKASELGLKDTNFVTPSGLDAAEHYTTARDLARLAAYAMKNEHFAKAAASQSATLCYGNPPYKRTLTNHNKLLKNLEGAVGVKTGFTKKSGRCLVSAAERDGKRVIAVTLCDPNDWQDHKNLLEYGLSQINLTEISPENAQYEIPVISGGEKSVNVNIEPFIVSSVGESEFSFEVNLPEFVYAPIEKGEKIGSVVYKEGQKIIATENLYAQCDISLSGVKKNVPTRFKENLELILKKFLEK